MASFIPEFGARIDGASYVMRLGGYGIIRDGKGRIAVVVTPRGMFLPGGGMEANESAEQALLREAREECGLVIGVNRLVGVADELVYAEDEQTYFRKRCAFFVATVVGSQGTGSEPDHELVWLPLEEAATQLQHESQRWMVAAAFRGYDDDQ